MFTRLEKAAAFIVAAITVASALVGVIIWLSGRAAADDLKSLASRVSVQEALRTEDHETLNRLDRKTDLIKDDVSAIKAAVQRR